MATESATATLDEQQLPLAGGAVAGAAAWLAGYLVTYVWTRSAILSADVYQGLEALGNAPPVWKVVGWVFYDAHLVRTNVPGLFGTTSVVDLIARYEALSPGLYVVAPLALAVAGALLARRAGAADLADGARTGALVVVGYLPLAAIGAYAIQVPVGERVASPDLVTAIALAGLAFPLVCGAVGGALASRL
jgi:hypothetical protein